MFVDKGYRGKKHHPEGLKVNVSGDTPSKSLYHRRLARRRSCVEAVIGHLKADCRMGRNYLHGEQGDSLNALLSGSGQNVRKLIKIISESPIFLFFFSRAFCIAILFICKTLSGEGPRYSVPNKLKVLHREHLQNFKTYKGFFTGD